MTLKTITMSAKTELIACQALGWKVDGIVLIVSGNCPKVSLPMRFGDPTLGNDFSLLQWGN